MGKELTCTTKTYAAYSLMAPEVKRASCTSSPSPESAPFRSASSRSRFGARTVTWFGFGFGFGVGVDFGFGLFSSAWAWGQGWY